MKEIFLILALLTNAPQPAPNYCYPVGGESAEIMLNNIICGNYEAQQDFNGDQQLTIADYYSTKRRHYISMSEGTALTIDRDAVEAITTKFFPDEEPIYYEFDFIGAQPCRQYEITVEEIATANLYLEFADECTNIKLSVNPYTETVTATKGE
jgi:hypothetical protein